MVGELSHTNEVVEDMSVLPDVEHTLTLLAFADSSSSPYDYLLLPLHRQKVPFTVTPHLPYSFFFRLYNQQEANIEEPTRLPVSVLSKQSKIPD